MRLQKDDIIILYIIYIKILSFYIVKINLFIRFLSKA